LAYYCYSSGIMELIYILSLSLLYFSNILTISVSIILLMAVFMNSKINVSVFFII
jgi:hypothetical protein